MSKDIVQIKNRPLNKSLNKKKKKLEETKKIKSKGNKKNNKPINKFSDKKTKKAYNELINPKNNLSVSIITATNKEEFFSNIFENYQRQKYDKKELIIILNKNTLDIEKFKKKAKKCKNIQVFQIDEEKDLSDCINFGVEQSSSDLVAKFDDDDYYGANYLSEAIYAIENTKAGVVGKSKFYTYFEDKNVIGLRKIGVENSYTKYIHGPTLVIKRDIYNKYKFKNMPYGADQRFLKDCIKDKIKIFSTSRKNFIYFRHKTLENHTWKIGNSNYIKKFSIIKKTKNYAAYADI